MTETTVVNVSGNNSKRVLYIGTWNVRTLRTGHWDILLEEARKFHVDLLGLCETHLTNTETLFDKDYFTVLLSSRTDVGREGVGILISPTSQLQHCLKSYDAVSSRIIQLEDGVVNFIQVYAPTSGHSDQEAEQFYDMLQSQVEKVPKKENVIIMGDFNAKIGSDFNTWSPTMGKFGLLLEFCLMHKLAVINTFFQHKACRKSTWISPCGQYKNQIDFVIANQNSLKMFQNCRSYCSAEIGSDHNLVLAKVQLQPTKAKHIKTIPKANNVSRFNDPAITE